MSQGDAPPQGGNSDECPRQLLPSAGAAVIVDGLRYIVPYKYTFTATAKGRWFGRTLLDVFTTEFPRGDNSAAYYAAAINDGRIARHSHQQSIRNPEMPIEARDTITHCMHRHESPILGITSIEALTPTAAGDGNGEDDEGIREATKDLVVVNKPCSVPVHPCGRYHCNTIVELLQGAAMMNTAPKKKLKLYPCHRLDKGVSGVLALATTPRMAATMGKVLSHSEDSSQQRSDRQPPARKLYVCRVRGRFPCVQPDGACCGEAAVGSSVAVSATDNSMIPRFVTEIFSSGIGSVICVDRAMYCESPAEGRFACLTHEESLLRLRKRQRSPPCNRGDDDDTAQDPPGSRTAADRKSAEDVQSKREAMRVNAQRDPTATREMAKTSISRFALLHYDPQADESVVLCIPETGRSHQLRVHLRALGHPIIDDMMYNECPRLWKWRGVVKDEDCNNSARPRNSTTRIDLAAASSYSMEELRAAFDAARMDGCADCATRWPLPEEALSSPPLSPSGTIQDEMQMCLHAWSYELSLPMPQGGKRPSVRVRYSTELPLWALPT